MRDDLPVKTAFIIHFRCNRAGRNFVQEIISKGRKNREIYRNWRRMYNSVDESLETCEKIRYYKS